MACNKNHEVTDIHMQDIPIDQGGTGRHKCASCAYEQGFKDGVQRKEHIDLKTLFNSLEESQKGDRRHKSPHAAYAFGYLNGVTDSYRK